LLLLRFAFDGDYLLLTGATPALPLLVNLLMIVDLMMEGVGIRVAA
jgi:hypothetical protein